MVKYFLFALCLISPSIIFSQTPDWDTYKIMTYNLLGYPNSFTFIDYRYNDLAAIVEYAAPDIVSINELRDDGDDRYADTLLYRSFNANGGPIFQRADIITPSGDLNNMLFYNAEKFTLINHNQVPCVLRDFDHFELMLNDTNLPCHHDTIFLDIITTHLKAGTNAGDPELRLEMAGTIMDYISTIDPTHNIQMLGDFNLYDETDLAYQVIITPTVNHTMIDSEGPWTRSDVTDVSRFTQSTRTTSNPGTNGGASSGLDDRFDFVLHNSIMEDNSQNISFVEGSYTCLGNDGLHYDKALIDAPTNAAVPQSIAQDLFDMSDHYPVLKSYLVTWPTAPQNLAITGENTGCTDNQYTYSVPAETGCVYDWNVIGGTIINGQGSPQVLVTWDANVTNEITCNRTCTQ